MSFELVHLGSDQYLDANSIIAVASTLSTSIKQLIKKAHAKESVINLTHGQTTRSAIFTIEGSLILTARAPEILAKRLQNTMIQSGLDLEPDDIEPASNPVPESH